MSNLLAAGVTAADFTPCINRGRSWLRFERAITHTELFARPVCLRSREVAFMLMSPAFDFQAAHDSAKIAAIQLVHSNH